MSFASQDEKKDANALQKEASGCQTPPPPQSHPHMNVILNLVLGSQTQPPSVYVSVPD